MRDWAELGFWGKRNLRLKPQLGRDPLMVENLQSCKLLVYTSNSLYYNLYDEKSSPFSVFLHGRSES